MSAKRATVLVLAIAATTWLSIALISLFRVAQQIPPMTFPDTASPVETVAARAAPNEPPAAQIAGTRRAEAPLAFVKKSVDERPQWQQRLDRCVLANPGTVTVCKNELEPTDPEWAPRMERGIGEFVADTSFVRLSAEP